MFIFRKSMGLDHILSELSTAKKVFMGPHKKTKTICMTLNTITLKNKLAIPLNSPSSANNASCFSLM